MIIRVLKEAIKEIDIDAEMKIPLFGTGKEFVLKAYLQNRGEDRYIENGLIKKRKSNKPTIPDAEDREVIKEDIEPVYDDLAEPVIS